MQEKSNLQLQLEQQLQFLIPAEGAPPEIKEEVFATLDTLELIGDLTDLFTAKFGSAGSEFLDLTDVGASEEE